MFTTLYRMLPYIFSNENTGTIIGGTITSIVEAGLNIAAPLVLGKAFSALSENESVDFLGIEASPVSLVTIFGAIWFLREEIAKARDLIFSSIGPKTGVKLTSDYTELMMNQSIIDYRKDQMGDKIGRMVPALEASTLLSDQLFKSIFPTIFEMAVTTGLLTKWYGYQVAVSIAAMMVSYIGFAYLAKETISQLNNNARAKTNDLFARLESLLSNYETTLYFDKLEYELITMNHIYDAYAESITQKNKIEPIISSIQSSISGIIFTILSSVFADEVLQGQYTVNDFIFLSIYLLQFLTRLLQFAKSMHFSAAALNQIQAVFEEFDQLAKMRAPDIGDELKLEGSTAEIVFDDVHFSYQNTIGEKVEILKGVSFKIPAGQTLGIVGPSGSGKSTIFNLLFGFLSPDSGRILIDGQDISTVSLKSLRQAIGIIPQTPHLFNDTLRWNVAYGSYKNPEEVGEASINRGIEAACLTDFVASSKDGINYNIGERGDNLSGGQKQRLATAMTVMKNPKIYIFDEATAALDSKTEMRINENLRNISRDKSTLVIAHRLSYLKDVDNIIVLNNGHVAEQGNHQALLGENGLYAELWRTQNLEAELEEKLEAIRSQSRSPSRSHASLFGKSKDDVLIDVPLNSPGDDYRF